MTRTARSTAHHRLDKENIPMSDPVPLLQQMIRFRGVNPPGNEAACVRHVAGIMENAGADVRLMGSDPDRPNLVARVRGAGLAPPLLLHAHADVVPTDGQHWTHPPFEGRIIDGHVWGRGAIDMLGALAMMVSALVRLRAEGAVPAGDVVLAVSPDEEAGSRVGAGYLVREHRDLFEDIAYGVGEDGGAVLSCLPGRVHPIVVAEKRACWTRLSVRGRGGHASRQGWSGTSMGKLARLLGRLEEGRLPTHVTPALDRMLEALAAAAEEPLAGRLRDLRDPDGKGEIPYDLLAEADAVYLDSVLRNTVNATIVRTPEKINMLPSEFSVDLDGRILPGDWTVEDFRTELRELIGPDGELELLLEGDAMPPPVFGGFFDTIASVMRDADPDGLPLPMITPASTDARLFAGLGIACYGWVPMLLPAGSRYQDAMHAADERVPVEAVRFGADRFHDLLLRYR
ncbi:M20/M25/M40 family metallo-hydrolase [Streptomyces sp. NPDC127066]|uniref:M20/M25/M40 family metallo-hydrolase n=1 Tax=Streptomyces sp. NPDC127066 TaxID=3347125 RepID=UPI003668FB22